MADHDYFAGEVGAKRIKWIEALESGEYKQAQGQLGDADSGFCCLGLGCHVLDIEYDPEDGNSEHFARVVELHSEDAELYEFDENGGRLNAFFYKQSSLVGANDDSSAGFKRIGRFIRDNPEKVFQN